MNHPEHNDKNKGQLIDTDKRAGKRVLIVFLAALVIPFTLGYITTKLK